MRLKRLKAFAVILVTSVAALPFNIAPANASGTELHGSELPVQAVIERGQIRNVNSGKCLVIPGGSKTPGVGAVQWPCKQPATSGYEQVWEISLSPGFYQLKNVASGLCLAIPGGSYTIGEKVVQWPCNGRSEQQWEYIGGTYRVRHSYQCLSIASASRADGASAIQWTCNSNPSGNPEQRWSELFI